MSTTPKVDPSKYAAQLAELAKRAAAADRNSAASYYSVGMAVMECFALGALGKEVAAAAGRSMSGVSQIKRAMADFPDEPRTEDECKRFMAAWNGRAPKVSGASGVSRNTDPTARLAKALKACSRAGVKASDIIPIVSAVYGRTAASAAVAAAA